MQVGDQFYRGEWMTMMGSEIFVKGKREGLE